MEFETIKPSLGGKIYSDKTIHKINNDGMIAIVRELFDRNIFISGYKVDSGRIAIRIPVEGFSEENLEIVKNNCINNPSNWVWVTQNGNESKKSAWLDNIEIFVECKEDEQDQAMELLRKETDKIKLQDIQIARSEVARESYLPRFTLEGLYIRSGIEKELYDENGNIDEDVKDEVISIYCTPRRYENGIAGRERPEFYYDSKSGTYLREEAFFGKIRLFEIFTEISGMINEKMSDEQKYRIIYMWMVQKFNYAYSALYHAYYFREDNPEKKEYLGKKIDSCQKTERGYIKNNLNSIMESNYAVCLDLAEIYKIICNGLGLPCECVQGNIDSGEYYVGHSWNVIALDGKIKHVDISSAIHCKDGFDKQHSIDDFFAKEFEELLTIDGGRHRSYDQSSQETIDRIAKNNGISSEDVEFTDFNIGE